MKAINKTAKRGREKESRDVEEAGDKERAALVQSRMKSKFKPVDTCEVNGALSDFFDGLGIAHNKVDHPLFKRFVQKLKNAPADYKLPSRPTLSGSILDQQHQVNVDERSESLKHEGTPRTRCGQDRKSIGKD